MPEGETSYCYAETPIGPLLLAGDDAGLSLVSFQSGSRVHRPRDGWRHARDGFPQARRELEEYFAGRRMAFTVPLRLAGTAFQNAVWTSLQEIPFGATTTYRELAVRVGRPAAVCAVGAANGANPLPIIIPCHRVIGSNGSLTGFGGGIEVKRFLLALEQGGATAPPRGAPR